MQKKKKQHWNYTILPQSGAFQKNVDLQLSLLSASISVMKIAAPRHVETHQMDFTRKTWKYRHQHVRFILNAATHTPSFNKVTWFPTLKANNQWFPIKSNLEYPIAWVMMALFKKRVCEKFGFFVFLPQSGIQDQSWQQNVFVYFINKHLSWHQSFFFLFPSENQLVPTGQCAIKLFQC